MNIADAPHRVDEECGLTGGANEAHDVVLAIIDLPLGLCHCMLAARCIGVVVHLNVAIPLQAII